LKRQQAGAARRRHDVVAPEATVESGEPARALLLGGLIAVYVARPLLPSETPTTLVGDGLPFVMLTLILALGWLLMQLKSPGRLRFGIVEGGWLALLAWQAASAALTVRSGYGRAAVNAFWEWVGLGIGYLLLRQLLRDDREKRAVTMVMIGLALLVSLDGVHQFAIETPITRAYYALHPDEVLKELGIQAPPGSAARRLFEQRLLSSEPTATFALANSLAGFLTPWLLVTLGLLLVRPVAGAEPKRCPGDPMPGHRLRSATSHRVLAVCALPIAACLVLTKSRAGYLAALLGFAMIMLVSRRTGRRTWQIVAAAAAVVVVLVATGIAFGSLDRQIFSQAMQSLSYRWQYWHGALGIVKDHPWFGCGPGNFQDEYPRYKLPLASEAVADPHNLLFEVWATSGTPALAALVAILVGAALQCGGLRQSVSDAPVHITGASPRLCPSHQLTRLSRLRNAVLAALGGLLLAFVVGLFTTVGLPWPLLLAGCLILPALVFFSSAWIEDGQLPSHVPFLAGLALVVNLLVAGGISFSGVAGSLWLLLTIATPDDPRRQPLLLPRWAVNGSCVVVAALGAACYLTAYRPVLECRGLIAQANRQPADARRALLAATVADPLADEPWRQLAAGDFALWQRQPAAERADAWQQAQREVLKRRPHSSAAWLEAAERYFAAYRQASDEQKQLYLAAALEHFQQAARLYPNDAMVHAEWALALAAAGRSEAAHEAARALKLHQQTPHADLKLPEDLLRATRKLLRTSAHSVVD
jgi:hypothetical protein